MVVGLLIRRSALVFIPAANVPSYPLFLGAEIVLAAGVTSFRFRPILLFPCWVRSALLRAGSI